MEVFNALDKSPSKIETFLTKASLTKSKTYGSGGSARPVHRTLRLRPTLFHHRPGREIPIHNHFYYQTMFILSGRAAVFSTNLKRTKSRMRGRPAL